MAAVFKRPRSQYWYATWIDANGKRQRKCTNTTDKKAAELIANELGKQAALRREGVIDATQDRFREQERRPLADHLAEFHASLQARSRTAQHCRETRAMVERIITGCHAERIADLTASAVERTIAQLQRITRAKSPSDRPATSLSARTKNAHLRAIKSFTGWLVDDRRARLDPLQTLGGANEETDKRHVRRELTPAELVQLIEATAAFTRPEHFAPGPDRAMLYRLAFSTGLRAGELRSLTPESFCLDESPIVTVAAAYSKNRKTAELPLNGILAEQLRGWLADRPPREPVFGRIPKHTARILRADLAHARKQWIDAAGDNQVERARREASDFLKYRDSAGDVADFHALRHTFISAVVSSGASVKVAQELARHSTPTLTIGRYSHARLHDLRGAVEAIAIPGPVAECSNQPASIKLTAAAG